MTGHPVHIWARFQFTVNGSPQEFWYTPNRGTCISVSRAFVEMFCRLVGWYRSFNSIDFSVLCLCIWRAITISDASFQPYVDNGVMCFSCYPRNWGIYCFFSASYLLLQFFTENDTKKRIKHAVNHGNYDQSSLQAIHAGFGAVSLRRRRRRDRRLGGGRRRRRPVLLLFVLWLDSAAAAGGAGDGHGGGGGGYNNNI